MASCYVPYIPEVIFKGTSGIDILRISCEIALRWMLQDMADD